MEYLDFLKTMMRLGVKEGVARSFAFAAENYPRAFSAKTPDEAMNNIITHNRSVYPCPECGERVSLEKDALCGACLLDD